MVKKLKNKIVKCKNTKNSLEMVSKAQGLKLQETSLKKVPSMKSPVTTKTKIKQS